MTKQELCRMASQNTGVPLYDTEKIANELFSIIGRTIADGDDVFIRGFATITAVTRKERKARDIGRNTVITVPQHRTAKLRPSPRLLRILNRHE